MRIMKGRIASIIIACFLGCLAISGTACAEGSETIYIAEGGHYDAGPFATWSSGEIWINMTVEGNGSVDVYLMTFTQYYNSYAPYSDNASAVNSISFMDSSVENTRSTRIHYSWNGSYETYSELYVVIDNRDCALTEDDASPSGPVKVALDISVTTEEFDMGLEWLGLMLLLSFAAPIIIVVIIVVIVVLATRNSGKNQPPPPPMYYPVSPPPPPPTQ